MTGISFQIGKEYIPCFQNKTFDGRETIKYKSSIDERVMTVFSSAGLGRVYSLEKAEKNIKLFDGKNLIACIENTEHYYGDGEWQVIDNNLYFILEDGRTDGKCLYGFDAETKEIRCLLKRGFVEPYLVDDRLVNFYSGCNKRKFPNTEGVIKIYTVTDYKIKCDIETFSPKTAKVIYLAKSFNGWDCWLTKNKTIMAKNGDNDKTCEYDLDGKLLKSE